MYTKATEIIGKILDNNSDQISYEEAYRTFYNFYNKERDESIRKVIFILCKLTYKNGKRVIISDNQKQLLYDVLMYPIRQNPKLKEAIDLF